MNLIKDKKIFLRYVIFLLAVFSLLLSFTGQGLAIEVGETPQDVDDVFIYEPEGVEVESWVENLEIPWQLIFLPESDRALVTERPGRIRLIENGSLAEANYAELDAAHVGEGGLLGLAHHPELPAEPYIYTMYTYQHEDGNYYNRISRLTDRGSSADSEEVILDNIPAARIHNGGRIKFGPDDRLYITTGDVGQPGLAQRKDNLAGKILRLNPDGSLPEDNPYQDSPVYSLGHRNPQGLAWNSAGDLFISDHGPSGENGLQAKDMIKLIEPGGNYGWPNRIGYFGDGEYHDPLIMWPDAAVPPSGAVFLNDVLYVATLRSRALLRISFETEDELQYQAAEIERWFAQDNYSGRYGRLRDVNSGPDGSLYLLTSNRDGRGSPLPGDDKIYRLKIDN